MCNGSIRNILFSLVKVKLDGHELPNTLPDHLVPPSKRHLATNDGAAGKNSGLYPSIANSGSGEQISGES